MKVAAAKQSTKARPRAKSTPVANGTAIAPETPIFFVNEPNQSGAGFPADIKVTPRASLIETVNFIVPAPAVVVRPRIKQKQVKSKKTSAKRTRARTDVRQPACRLKQTAAARTPAVPDSAPRGPVVTPALTRQVDRVTPLPRAAAVTLHRKQSLIDIISYWLRQRSTGVSRFLARPLGATKTRRKVPSKAERLVAENAALRAELAQLRARLQT